MIYNSLDNSLGGLPGYDAWLTTDVEYEKREAQAEYCLDNHDWDGPGDCYECELENEYYNQGPDPDEANDAQREREWEAAQEPDYYDTPLFEHTGE